MKADILPVAPVETAANESDQSVAAPATAPAFAPADPDGVGAILREAYWRASTKEPRKLLGGLARAVEAWLAAKREPAVVALLAEADVGRLGTMGVVGLLGAVPDDLPALRAGRAAVRARFGEWIRATDPDHAETIMRTVENV